MRFEQRLLEPELTEAFEHGRVEYTDLQTGYKVVCTVTVGAREGPWPDGRMQNEQGKVRREYPRYMHIEERKLTANHFSYAIEPLIEIFKASVETGNPVRWC